jgi:hypothetical protein
MGDCMHQKRPVTGPAFFAARLYRNGVGVMAALASTRAHFYNLCNFNHPVHGSILK